LLFDRQVEILVFAIARKALVPRETALEDRQPEQRPVQDGVASEVSHVAYTSLDRKGVVYWQSDQHASFTVEM
jgi:hypothetical protein